MRGARAGRSRRRRDGSRPTSATARRANRRTPVPPTTRFARRGPLHGGHEAHRDGGRRILVTGSAGHLGEALVRALRGSGHDTVGLDLVESAHTDVVASVTDRAAVRAAVAGADAVLHAATLHKPHVMSHSRQEFVDTNVTGTLVLLEEAVAAGVGAFVHTSTTSAFGRALTPGRAGPPPGSPRTSSRAPATSTGSRRSRPKTSANSSPGTAACPAWCCAPPGSSPSRTTASRYATSTRTPTSRSTNCCTGASTCRTSRAPTRPPWHERRRSASVGTS